MAACKTQADKLIDEVHTVLGRDRDGSTRLGAATGDQLLLGGLRIGKSDPEGHPDGDGCACWFPEMRDCFKRVCLWHYCQSR